jgi:hypothetical protein
LRQGEQRRTSIEPITRINEGTHFSARVHASLKDLHRKSLFRQSNGCGDACDSGSNDDGSFRHIPKATTKGMDGLPFVWNVLMLFESIVMEIINFFSHWR